MHELSIAAALVSGVVEALEGAGEARAVEAVTARIGDLSGVVVEALAFAWPVAAEGTRCAGAALRVERVAGRVRCAVCGVETTLGSPPRFRCGVCDRPTGEVVGGREMELVSVELADEGVRAEEVGHAAAAHS